jgi:phospholipase A1
MTLRFLIGVIVIAASSLGARAQTMTPAPVNRSLAWQACAQLSEDPAARLACYDRWSLEHPDSAPSAPSAAASPPPSAPIEPDCNDPKLSSLSRFWELERASDCGRFNIRGFYPISLSWALADSVNTTPTSPTPGHTASPTAYVPNEGRIQLSIRTKIGQGLWPDKDFGGRDSLWFAYTQQSYWQLFSPSISRPFRITDHEPEIIYIVPTDAELALGWRWRYSGISLNHQSNGQPLPLSRSWNRVILMAGMEKDQRFTLTGRVWQRISEDAQNDDNPEISDLVGRAEIGVSWNVNKDNTLAMTVRHSLNSPGNGSVRLEWLQTLSNNQRNQANRLRLHTQLFSGYGDSLLDYNYYRTVLIIGLSLVDW